AINTVKENDELLQGNIVATIGSPKSLNILQDSDINFKIGPPLKKGEHDPITYGTTGMLSVTSTSDNQEMAAEFAKNMTKEEIQKQFNETTLYIPPLKSAQSIYDDSEYLKQIASYTEYARTGIGHPDASKIMDQIRSDIQSMMTGDKTPEEAADDAAEEIKEIVEND